MSLPDLKRKYALPGDASWDVVKKWAPRALDRLSCTVTSQNYLEVLVPFAKLGEWEDFSWVAGALANFAKKSYQRLTGNQDAQICIRRHKKEVRDLGRYGGRVTQRCGRDRPAFVLEDLKRSFNFYAACGQLPDQSPRHQTLRGICRNVHAAASLLHAAVRSMGAFVLRADFITHDPDSPASVTTHGDAGFPRARMLLGWRDATGR